MDDHAKDERIESLRQRCREHGLVLTPQRRAFLRAVLAADDHPTDDRVHAALARRRVRVSRATVQTIRDRIFEDVFAFSGCSEAGDDMTVVVVKRNP